MLKIAAVATLVGTSEKVVRGAIARGDLRAHQTGPKTIRIKQEWVDDWIENCPVKTTKIDQNGLRQVKPAGARRGRLRAVGGSA